MYQDASKNPITAVQGVDALLGPIQAALAGGAFRPAPQYHYDTGVSLQAYERLQAQYAELAAAAEHHIRSLQLKGARQALEITRLKAELASRRTS